VLIGRCLSANSSMDLIPKHLSGLGDSVVREVGRRQIPRGFKLLLNLIGFNCIYG